MKSQRIRKPKATQNELETQAQSELSQEGRVLPSPPQLPSYDRKFEPIREHIMRADPSIEWRHIREWLEKIPRSLDQSIEMLAEQPGIAMRADRLLRLAKRELERFELDWKDATGAMRDLARDYWESKKLKGMRKQITNDMIDDYIIENWGEKYKEMYLRLRDMKNTKEHIETMCGQVIDRAPDLRRLVDRYSGKGSNSTPTWMVGQKKRRDS